MKAIILNATAWMIVPVMDALAKHLSLSMDVFQITWARYFFTVVFTLTLMLLFWGQVWAATQELGRGHDVHRKFCNKIMRSNL